MNAGMVIMVPALSWIDTILVDARLPSASITRRSIIWRTSPWLLFWPLFKLRAYAPSRFKRCRLRVDMPPIDEPGKAWGLIQSFDSGPHNVVFFFQCLFLSCDPSEVQLEVKIQPNKDLEGDEPLKVHGSVVVWLTYWRHFLAWPPCLDPIRATEKESCVSPSIIASSPAAAELSEFMLACRC